MLRRALDSAKTRRQLLRSTVRWSLSPGWLTLRWEPTAAGSCQSAARLAADMDRLPRVGRNGQIRAVGIFIPCVMLMAVLKRQQTAREDREMELLRRAAPPLKLSAKGHPIFEQHRGTDDAG